MPLRIPNCIATASGREGEHRLGEDIGAQPARRNETCDLRSSPFNIGERSRTMQACHRRESLRYLGKRKRRSLTPACPLLPSSSVNSHNPYNTQSDDIQLTLVTI